MIALVTPSGMRPDQFRLCAAWMHRQDYAGEVLWVIVDDGLSVTTNNVQPGFRDNWTILKVYPRPAWQGTNTQGRNIQAGIIAMLNHPDNYKINAIFIIEDDDYYKANYLSEMVKRMGTYDLIGETNTIYYNVQWRLHCDNNNKQHSSLFQTAFSPALVPLFLTCMNQKFIDADIWAKCKNKLLFHAGTLSVGIKGMPGRGGIGAGHTRNMAFSPDPSMNYLITQIGNDDAIQYAGYYSINSHTQHRGLNTPRRRVL
jgi:hypothetical protein